jgi:hypothetical protein
MRGFPAKDIEGNRTPTILCERGGPSRASIIVWESNASDPGRNLGQSDVNLRTLVAFMRRGSSRNFAIGRPLRKHGLVGSICSDSPRLACDCLPRY